ncbi:hypothetical protein N7492_000258 [Penicillium capsulatum]|uniref:Uncharacterized protein n=1 Tax=Penicillium capsulatum TaxID=69766 RepID=A0A9W9IRE6_9EURO|nr:hypothetical protein N7492_000258 [Penicillium capsulatum]KAJ6130676.1 hypothetical protein N7512_003456 [Penicillium capsulatum]
MDARLLPDFKVLSFPIEGNDVDDEKLSSPFDDPISLQVSSSWSYCGPLLSVSPDLLPPSFHDWVNSTVNGPLNEPFISFLEFVHEFMEVNQVSHYWITVRATQGTHEFDIPRWHTDDLFFSPRPPQRRRLSILTLPAAITLNQQTSSRRQRAYRRCPSTIQNTATTSSSQVTSTHPNPTNWKLSTTLLGPGTLFISHKKSPLARQIEHDVKRAIRDSSPAHICGSVRCVGCATTAESVRTRLADALGRYEIVQPRRGQCAFFKVGQDQGAVHSEPMCHGDRIFVNVVPGHEADLKNLMAKWGMEYPRAWCVGLPT